MAATLANQGRNPVTGVQAIDKRHVPKILSVMSSCGMYDGSGTWTYDIGLPSKSGVGGGIASVLPGKSAIAVFSPRLDSRGNSNSPVYSGDHYRKSRAQPGGAITQGER